MKPGDLIFYSATFYEKPGKKKKRKQKHDMVHVEIYLGPEDQSIGARWNKGVIQIFDTYKFKSTNYYDIVFHYRSLETWLDGVCKSFCSIHPWDRGEKHWSSDKYSIFALDEEIKDEEASGDEEEEVTE